MKDVDAALQPLCAVMEEVVVVMEEVVAASTPIIAKEEGLIDVPTEVVAANGGVVAEASVFCTAISCSSISY